MPKSFRIDILTPENKVYEGEIESLVAPAASGYLGILADHAPLMATLASGKITVKEPSGKMIIFSSRGGGFLEVSKNKATLLADAVEPAT